MKEEILDKIEAYLNGDMSPQDEAQFDTEIEQNPELAAAVDNFGVANDAIELLIEDNLRAELNNLKAEESVSQGNNVVSINKNKPVAKMRSLRTYFAAAASVALLLGFFGMNWAGDNYSNAALGEEMYSGYDLPNVRSGNNTVHPFSEGLTAFQNKNYDQAIQFFKGIVVDDPRYPEAQFYLGQAYLESDNFGEAAKQFEKVAMLNDIRYTEYAEWYQIIAQLSSGETDANFDKLLTKIAGDKDHTFNKQAMELVGKLNSFWRKLAF